MEISKPFLGNILNVSRDVANRFCVNSTVNVFILSLYLIRTYVIYTSMLLFACMSNLPCQ